MIKKRQFGLKRSIVYALVDVDIRHIVWIPLFQFKYTILV